MTPVDQASALSASGRRCPRDAERAALAADFAARYEAGAGVLDIGRETGWSYGFVHALLVEAGVTLRRRGPRSGQGARGGQ